MLSFSWLSVVEPWFIFNGRVAGECSVLRTVDNTALFGASHFIVCLPHRSMHIPVLHNICLTCCVAPVCWLRTNARSSICVQGVSVSCCAWPKSTRSSCALFRTWQITVNLVHDYIFVAALHHMWFMCWSSLVGGCGLMAHIQCACRV